MRHSSVTSKLVLMKYDYNIQSVQMVPINELCILLGLFWAHSPLSAPPLLPPLFLPPLFLPAPHMSPVLGILEALIWKVENGPPQNPTPTILPAHLYKKEYIPRLYLRVQQYETKTTIVDLEIFDVKLCLWFA